MVAQLLDQGVWKQRALVGAQYTSLMDQGVQNSMTQRLRVVVHTLTSCVLETLSNVAIKT